MCMCACVYIYIGIEMCIYIEVKAIRKIRKEISQGEETVHVLVECNV